MAVTSYITMDGMLMGEMTNGVMRNYGTDALGSVVETVLNGVEEYTYQYKPYGGLLAKTGVGADPLYLWNGGSGYRATSLAFSDTYVRNRHYSSTSSSWSTSDRLFPQELPYIYARDMPTSLPDPSGLSPLRTWGGRFKCQCGMLQLNWILQEMGAPSGPGYIVQRITANVEAFDCNGVPITTAAPCQAGRTYYEAFPVVNGSSNLQDNWELVMLNGGNNSLYCSYGSMAMSAGFKYYQTLPKGFSHGKVQCSGNLLSSYDPPEGFTEEPGSEASLNFSWGCCIKGVDGFIRKKDFIGPRLVCCTKAKSTHCSGPSAVATYPGGTKKCSLLTGGSGSIGEA